MWKLLALVLACVPVSVAFATSMVVLDVVEQADESHAFVTAVVGASRTVQTERMVYTHTELVVSEVHGGSAPARMILRQAGGVVGDRTVHIEGDAKLVEGERIAAFVRGRDGLWYFTALGQSVWYLDDANQVRQAIDPGHLLQRGPLGEVVPADHSPLPYTALQDLVDDVSMLRFGGAL